MLQSGKYMAAKYNYNQLGHVPLIPKGICLGWGETWVECRRLLQFDYFLAMSFLIVVFALHHGQYRTVYAISLSRVQQPYVIRLNNLIKSPCFYMPYFDELGRKK